MEERKKNRRNILFVSIITSFITTFMGSSVNLSVADMENDFGVSAAAVGWVITVYMLTCAALAVPFGKIADAMSKKKILVAGIFIFSVSSFGASLSSSFRMLIISRICQGTGASMIFSTNIAVLAEAFSDEKRGRALGYATGANFLGLSAGPVLGGMLNRYFGWQSVFTVAGSISAVICILAALKLSSDKKMSRIKDIDLKGSALYVISITAFMYGLSSAVSSFKGIIILTAGMVLFVIFFISEKKSRHPLVDIKMFSENKPYLFSNLAALINYGSNFAVSYLVALYLQAVCEQNSQTAGIIMISSPLVMSVLSPVAGKLSDRWPPYLISSAGAVVCTAAVAMFALLYNNMHIIMIVIILSVFGTGSALFASPNTNSVMAAAGTNNYASASSVLSTVRSMGNTMAMAVITAAVSVRLGEDSLFSGNKAAFLEMFQTCFYVFTAMGIIGIFMALRSKS